jgi:hypothetical protein
MAQILNRGMLFRTEDGGIGIALGNIEVLVIYEVSSPVDYVISIKKEITKDLNVVPMFLHEALDISSTLKGILFGIYFSQFNNISRFQAFSITTNPTNEEYEQQCIMNAIALVQNKVPPFDLSRGVHS